MGQCKVRIQLDHPPQQGQALRAAAPADMEHPEVDVGVDVGRVEADGLAIVTFGEFGVRPHDAQAVVRVRQRRAAVAHALGPEARLGPPYLVHVDGGKPEVDDQCGGRHDPDAKSPKRDETDDQRQEQERE